MNAANVFPCSFFGNQKHISTNTHKPFSELKDQTKKNWEWKRTQRKLHSPMVYSPSCFFFGLFFSPPSFLNDILSDLSLQEREKKKSAHIWNRIVCLPLSRCSSCSSPNRYFLSLLRTPKLKYPKKKNNSALINSNNNKKRELEEKKSSAACTSIDTQRGYVCSEEEEERASSSPFLHVAAFALFAHALFLHPCSSLTAIDVHLFSWWNFFFSARAEAPCVL